MTPIKIIASLRAVF